MSETSENKQQEQEQAKETVEKAVESSEKTEEKTENQEDRPRPRYSNDNRRNNNDQRYSRDRNDRGDRNERSSYNSGNRRPSSSQGAGAAGNGPGERTHLIEEDLMDRIKREARHKNTDHRQLLNHYLREALFKSRNAKQNERFLDKPYCPACGHDFRKGRPHSGSSSRPEQAKRSSSSSSASSKKGWKNLWGILK